MKQGRSVHDGKMFKEHPTLPLMVSEVGDIITIEDNRELKQYTNGKKAGLATRYKGGKYYIATLVAETFIGPRPSDKHILRHLNGLKYDNDFTNLAWLLRTSKNRVHNLNSRKIEVYRNDKLVKRFKSIREAAKHYGLSHQIVSRNARGITKSTKIGYTFKFMKGR